MHEFNLLFYAQLVIFAPLVCSMIVGLLNSAISKSFAHSITILGVSISSISAIALSIQVITHHIHYDVDLYTWLQINQQSLSIGIYIDNLTTIMLVMVHIISLMVHIYSIGYMNHEPGYQRFFSYISLFTFMMTVLVIANNFLQLFFGWEGVGLVSYLLIGFYFNKESAVFASLKAFLINRIGDFALLLGIGFVLACVGSLQYSDLFFSLSNMAQITLPYCNYRLVDAICLLLLIGAMGKSAQFPLHVWLPDSMEGPTPISALIHAATMVTAGVFMIARLSPLFNLSPIALNMMILVGGINCLFLGLLGVVQNDIKRVVAYSTLSQLGYMVVALGCGSESLAVFHLITHAFFKGLLFLAAGSVIVALHHEQDMRFMGGLAAKLPITYIAMIIGSLALIGIPPFAGFFSKDLILETADNAIQHTPWGIFAMITTYASIIITAIYSFRLIFNTFHGNCRSKLEHIKEPSMTILIPLILLSIMSIIVGWIGLNALNGGILNGSVYDIIWHNPVELTSVQMIMDSFNHLPIYFALFGIICAYMMHKFPIKLPNTLNGIRALMERKYFMDELYTAVLSPLTRTFGKIIWRIDDLIIDTCIVNGVSYCVGNTAKLLRKLQNGYINSYAMYVVAGVILLAISTNLLI